MGDRVDLGVGTFACIWWLFMCMIECGDTEILACRVLTWLFKIAKSLEAGGQEDCLCTAHGLLRLWSSAHGVLRWWSSVNWSCTYFIPDWNPSFFPSLVFPRKILSLCDQHSFSFFLHMCIV